MDFPQFFTTFFASVHTAPGKETDNAKRMLLDRSHVSFQRGSVPPLNGDTALPRRTEPQKPPTKQLPTRGKRAVPRNLRVCRAVSGEMWRRFSRGPSGRVCAVRGALPDRFHGELRPERRPICSSSGSFPHPVCAANGWQPPDGHNISASRPNGRGAAKMPHLKRNRRQPGLT